MNPKIDRLARDMEKTRAKISELQARLREQEREKTELENADIVAVFRSVNIAPQELADFIRLYKEQGGGAVSPAASPAGTGTQEQEDNEIEE